jgi:hypothetical protein
MTFFIPIFNWVCNSDGSANDVNEFQNNKQADKDVAAEIVDKLYSTEKHGDALKAELQGIIQTNGWRESLAEAIFEALELAVRTGRTMGPALQNAYDRAVEEAKKIEGFVHGNPLLCSIIAVGIVALLMPWLLEALGFGLEGYHRG